MCLSGLGQIIYGAVMLVALGLTLTSMFTPGWDEFKNDTLNQKFHTGLFQFACKLPNDTSSSSNNNSKDSDPCQQWWNNLPTSMKVVAFCMGLAVIIEVLALVWNFITFCACCCKRYIIHPLSIFATVLAIVLAIAIITYAIKHKNLFDNFKVTHLETSLNDIKKNGQIGYSFYLACGALAAAVINIFVGALTVCLAKHCL